MTHLTHIRVKPGVLEEESGKDMGGWSGRVTKQEEDLVAIGKADIFSLNGLVANFNLTDR